MEIGEKIKRLRIKKGYTQKTLASKLFVSRSVIAKWETGKRKPDKKDYEELSNVLGCSIEFLLNEETPEEIVLRKENKRYIRRRYVIPFSILGISISTIIVIFFIILNAKFFTIGKRTKNMNVNNAYITYEKLDDYTVETVKLDSSSYSEYTVFSTCYLKRVIFNYYEYEKPVSSYDIYNIDNRIIGNVVTYKTNDEYISYIGNFKAFQANNYESIEYIEFSSQHNDENVIIDGCEFTLIDGYKLVTNEPLAGASIKIQGKEFKLVKN